MRTKVSFIILTIFLSLSFIISKGPFISSKKSILNGIRNSNSNDISNTNSNSNPIDIILDFHLFQNVFKSFFNDCNIDLVNMEPLNNNRKTTSLYPPLFQHIGLSLNDLGDEVECLYSLTNNTYYMVADITVNDFYNKDDELLLNFLNIHQFSVGACSTPNCERPLTMIINLFEGFSNNNISDVNNDKNATYVIYDPKKDYKKGYYDIFYVLFLALLIYITLKIIVGALKIIYIPKGYYIYSIKYLNEEEKEYYFGDKNENTSIILDENNKLFESIENIQEYNPHYDFSYKFPLYLRIIRFFDLFNDIMLLSVNRNRYYNDNGLEVINFLKTIVLYFYIFSNTFTTLLALPSRDILNKEFFSSNLLFFYRFSSHSITCWIFLEGAVTAYKFMKFIKIQMSEYDKEKANKSCNFYLIIIYIKFVLLFIPKICTFLLCYYIFYIDILKFVDLFSAKTTFKYIVQKVITNNIICNNQNSIIFSSFYTFGNNAADFNTCYEFTFIYINILFCSLCLTFTVYITLLFKKIIIEIFFILLYFIFWFGLIFTVKDEKLMKENDIYNIYHFKGQDYLHKIAYLTLGVYHLGFMIGILSFNYDNIKIKLKERKNTKKSSNLKDFNELMDINSDNGINDNGNTNSLKNILNFKRGDSKDSLFDDGFYYPLTFLDGILMWLKKIKNGYKSIIIIICIALQYFISAFCKIYGYIKKEENEDYYFLKMKLDWILKAYFLFEKHIFLILFFIINIMLITFRKRGLFKKLIRSKLITAISREGFLIICLCYILNTFSFCGILLKIKFDITNFIIISIGNFLVIFMVAFLINIVFELPIRICIKKLLRLSKGGKPLIIVNEKRTYSQI